MMAYSLTSVQVAGPPPTSHGNERAIVMLRGERVALDRGDVSYAGWLQLCAAVRGDTVKLMLRDA